MAVRIVTDSGSDIPRDIARELNITVVPLYVQFGTRSYRDGVDISSGQLYEMLEHDPVIPTTSAAPPADFAATYSKLCQDNDSIVSIHISSKVSSTYASAQQGKEMLAGKGCNIEVVDSKLVTMALGLVAISAAKAAAEGQDTRGVLNNISKTIPALHVLGLLDSLKYVARGGRLGKVVPLLSSVLPVKPLLTLRDGHVVPTGAVRTRSKGIERVFDMVRSLRNVREIGIAHSSREDEIKSIIEKLKTLVPDVKPKVADLGSALGVHGGPGTLLVAVQEEAPEVSEIVKKPLVSLPSLQSLRDSLSQRIQRDVTPFLYPLKTAQVLIDDIR